ncbi:unnamed protein product [Closterium sp. Yama58-4]|nr:unnamed protein product [Closterium sp. Yama58-4]
MLPYLFPELSTFATVADLITHLRTSDARLRAALPTEFCAKNPPPLHWTLHFIVTRLPDTLSSVRDYFLARCPTELTVALLEEKLLAAEKSIVAVGAAPARARGARVAGVALGGEVVGEVGEEAVPEGAVAGVLMGVEAAVGGGAAAGVVAAVAAVAAAVAVVAVAAAAVAVGAAVVAAVVVGV